MMQPAVYQRREPEKTLLYHLVQENLETFIAHCNGKDAPVPRFVDDEFQAYLKCGILAYGAVRVYCKDCRFDRLVAFSCKKRGFCPSCMARRMSETAAHIVDCVVPIGVSTRQWVLSLPPPLRYLIAYDTEACSAVRGAFIKALFAWLRLSAKKKHGLQSAQLAFPGAITFVQRFGGALNLNVHFHTLVTDGVFVEDATGNARFYETPPPSQSDIQHITERVIASVTRWLQRKYGEQSFSDELSSRDNLLAACYAASIRNNAALGSSGQAEAVVLLGAHGASATEPKHRNSIAGFSLHASVAVDGDDRRALERLLRYMGRPPISEERLERTSDGQVIVRFKRPWSDGTTHVKMPPLELLARLTSIIPPPRVNQIIYHGVFAANSRLRKKVIPQRDDEDAESTLGTSTGCGPASGHRLGLRAMMARVFEIDVYLCPKCGSQMQQIAFITDPRAIRDVLHALKMPTAPPALAKARPQPQCAFEFSA